MLVSPSRPGSSTTSKFRPGHRRSKSVEVQVIPSNGLLREDLAIQMLDDNRRAIERCRALAPPGKGPEWAFRSVEDCRCRPVGGDGSEKKAARANLWCTLLSPLLFFFRLFTQLLEGLCTEHIGFALSCAVKALPPRKVYLRPLRSCLPHPLLRLPSLTRAPAPLSLPSQNRPRRLASLASSKRPTRCSICSRYAAAQRQMRPGHDHGALPSRAAVASPPPLSDQKHFQETVTPAVRESLSLYPACLERKNNVMQQLEKQLAGGLSHALDTIEEWVKQLLAKVRQPRPPSRARARLVRP